MHLKGGNVYFYLEFEEIGDTVFIVEKAWGKRLTAYFWQVKMGERDE